MAQDAGEGLYSHAVLQGQGGEGVPEIVKSHPVIDPGLVQQFFVYPPDGVRVEYVPGDGRHEQIGAVRVFLMLRNQKVHGLLGDDKPADGVAELHGAVIVDLKADGNCSGYCINYV